jgi:hypothetical protein
MHWWCIAVKSSVPQGMFVCFDKEVGWCVGIAVILVLLRTLIRRLYGVHRRSGVERGLDGKDLASAYVLRPLGWLS